LFATYIGLSYKLFKIIIYNYTCHNVTLTELQYSKHCFHKH